MMSEKRFFMVLGAGEPTYRHLTLTAASQEAERLAKQNPGQTFTILQSVASVRRTELLWSRHDADPQDGCCGDCPDIPF